MKMAPLPVPSALARIGGCLAALAVSGCSMAPSGPDVGSPQIALSTSVHSGGASQDTHRAAVRSQSGGAADSPSAPMNARDNVAQIDTPAELGSAQDTPAALSSEDLARELSNPNSPLASLTLKNTITVFEGDLPGADGEVGNVLLFQPAFPFPLNDDGTRNFFARPAFTLISQPVPQGGGGFDNEFGFGDIGYDVALGQSFDNGIIVIGGLQGSIPVGKDELSADQWRLGPEGIIAHLNQSRALGLFPAHLWDIGGGGEDFSTSSLQIFALKYLSDGWTVGSQPKLLYDWEGDQATIPLNVVLRKVTKFGSLPLQVSGEFDWFVEKNDTFGPEFAFTISITPVVPNFIYNAFKG